jgi:hypothetical protein
MPTKLPIRVEGEGIVSAPLGLGLAVLFTLVSVGAWGPRRIAGGRGDLAR